MAGKLTPRFRKIFKGLKMGIILFVKTRRYVEQISYTENAQTLSRQLIKSN